MGTGKQEKDQTKTNNTNNTGKWTEEYKGVNTKTGESGKTEKVHTWGTMEINRQTKTGGKKMKI